MTSGLNMYLADELIDDRLREAERFRRSRQEWRAVPDHYSAVTVRLARASDAKAIMRLSQLDGRRSPQGSILIAEVNGTVLAARSLENGASVANPFRPTAEYTELLELRSAHLKSAANGQVHYRRRGIRALLRSIGARQV